jgi:hypothetical protein
VCIEDNSLTTGGEDTEPIEFFLFSRAYCKGYLDAINLEGRLRR